MKTLPIETCKRLKEAGVEIETEFTYSNESIYTDRTKFFLGLSKKKYKKYIYYPAPNLEEAIEILQKGLKIKIENEYSGKYRVTIYGAYIISSNTPIIATTLLEAVNEMINYLIDNKLIGKK